MAQELLCGNCSVIIPPEYWNEAEETTCRGCGERLLARVYPARSRLAAEAAAPEKIEFDTEASCYGHPANRAAAACEVCGRFLCALCDLDLDGRHLCPDCLERGVVSKSPTLEDRRTLYDSMALALATWPLLTFWMPAFTAPMALFLVFRHWRTPGSILPRRRWRMWIAAGLALVEIVAVLMLAGFITWFAINAPRGKR